MWLRLHPSILSLSEFFTTLSSQALVGKELNGEELYQRLHTASPGNRALFENELRLEELLYQVGPGSRYSASEVPPILCTALPFLSDRPEELWDELAKVIRPRPLLPLGEQYRFVFDWLAQRLGKVSWIERSGASLPFVPRLHTLFPDAKFIHLYRDGRDTALSMENHAYFRLQAELAHLQRRFGLNPFSSRNALGLSPYMPYFEILRFQYFSERSYRETEMDLCIFGRYWSDMVVYGDRLLSRLPKEKVLHLRYEDLTQHPEEELSRLIHFISPSYRNDSWLKEASRLPIPQEPRWKRLSSTEADRLAEVCGPGMELLGYDGH